LYTDRSSKDEQLLKDHFCQKQKIRTWRPFEC
jgi:hypothetical protein